MLELAKKSKFKNQIHWRDETVFSLGMKQLETDPWQDVLTLSQLVKKNCQELVNNITDYGAFIELENGIEACSRFWTWAGLRKAFIQVISYLKVEGWCRYSWVLILINAELL